MEGGGGGGGGGGVEIGRRRSLGRKENVTLNKEEEVHIKRDVVRGSRGSRGGSEGKAGEREEMGTNYEVAAS